MDRRLTAKLEKMYPSCTHREIQELASGIEGGKYWRAADGLVFAIVLTRARLRDRSGWVAELAGLGRAEVGADLRPFTRKGRIALTREEGKPTVLLILGWPAFLWAMRKGEVARLVEGTVTGNLKGYVGVPALKEYLKYESGSVAGLSGRELG